MCARRSTSFSIRLIEMLDGLKIIEVSGSSRDELLTKLLEVVYAVSYTHLTLPTTERV